MLTSLYHDLKLTHEEMALALGCSAETVRQRMIAYGIDCRRAGSMLRSGHIMLPKESWKVSYLAGLIDGEGSILYRGRAKTLCRTITVTNTSRIVMDWLVENFGGVYHVHKQQEGNWRTCYRWYAHGHVDMWVLLNAILPFLVIKSDLAIEALAQIQSRFKEDHYIVSPEGVIA